MITFTNKEENAYNDKFAFISTRKLSSKSISTRLDIICTNMPTFKLRIFIERS